MKKVFVLALAFAGLTTAVKAQTGSILVQGNIDFTSQSQSSAKSNTLAFSPTVGYQFSSHFTAGLTADINSTKNDDGAGTVDKTSGFDLGPFIRYTQPLSNIFSVYGQLQGVFGSYKSTTNGSTNFQGNTVNISLVPAVFINLKNNFGLNFNIGGLSYQTDSPKGGTALNTFKFNFGQTLSIGVSKNFGGK